MKDANACTYVGSSCKQYGLRASLPLHMNSTCGFCVRMLVPMSPCPQERKYACISAVLKDCMGMRCRIAGVDRIACMDKLRKPTNNSFSLFDIDALTTRIENKTWSHDLAAMGQHDVVTKLCRHLTHVS